MFRGPSDTVGHFASVQMGFVESATRMGERFVIFDGHYFWENDNSNSLIVNAEADNNQNSYISIAKWLLQVASSEKITLLVFEGSLGTISEVADFARFHPGVRIYINLFYPEPGLSIPGTYDHFVGEITDSKLPSRLNDVKELLHELPNIRLACDTDSRSFLAQSLGIRIDATWYGRSPVGQLANKLTKLDKKSKRIEDPIKIFITVDILRFTALQLWWCINVIRFVTSINEQQTRKIEWTFNFMPEEVGIKFRYLIRFLPKHRIHFVKSKVALESYAERIFNADLIWLPLSSYYVSSSSGRVADAITLQKPILVPSGTYGDFEFSKWIRNWPTYRNQNECAQIILNIQHMIPLAEQQLKNQATAISEYYSNINQLKKVIGSNIHVSRKLYDESMLNENIDISGSRVTIINFAKALIFSLSPFFIVRFLKLLYIAIKSRFLKRIKE
jgi:hypothetical protein